MRSTNAASHIHTTHTRTHMRTHTHTHMMIAYGEMQCVAFRLKMASQHDEEVIVSVVANWSNTIKMASQHDEEVIVSVVANWSNTIKMASQHDEEVIISVVAM